MKNKSSFKNEFERGNTCLDVRLTPDLRTAHNKENVGQVKPDVKIRGPFIPSPLARKGGRRPGEGCKKGNHFTNTPSSVCPDFVRQTTSPARGEAKRLGFTLIELLVVVLIIGILAAVAVPQYQKSVEKSKAAQAITLLKSVYQAAEAYQLANGEWPSDFDELSINIPWTGTVRADENWPGGARSNQEWSLQLQNGTAYKGVFITRLSGKYKGGQFQIWKKHEGAGVPSDTLLCGEQKSGSYVLADGLSYCTKLFQGTTKLAEGSGGRVYTFLQ